MAREVLDYGFGVEALLDQHLEILSRWQELDVLLLDVLLRASMETHHELEFDVILHVWTQKSALRRHQIARKELLMRSRYLLLSHTCSTQFHVRHATLG